MQRRSVISKIAVLTLCFTLLFSNATYLGKTNAEDVIKTASGGLANLYWNVGQVNNIDSISMDISINQDIDPSLNLYICALGGFFNDVGFYSGIQTNTSGFTSKKIETSKNLGKGGIFSRWSERDLSAISIAEGGICQSAGYEGDFVGVRNGYQWKAGTYNIELKVMKSGFSIPEDSNNTWLGMFIYSYEDKTDKYMGAVRFPGKSITLKTGSLYSFVEIYGLPVPVDQVPNRIIGFSNLRINHKIFPLRNVSIGYQKGTNNTGKVVASEKELKLLMGKDVNDTNSYKYIYSPDGNGYYEDVDASNLLYHSEVEKPNIVENLEIMQKPTIISATTDLDYAYLKWNEPANAKNSGVIGYYIYRKLEDGESKLKLLNTSIVSSTSFKDATISVDNTYSYFIVPVNKYEVEGEASDKAIIKTNTVKTPTGVKVNKKYGSVELNWSKLEGDNQDEITGYNVYRGTASKCEEIEHINTDLLKEATYVDKNIQKDQTYFYTVKAVNKYGAESDASDEIVVSGEVGKPIKVVATKNNNKISLNWNPTEDHSKDDIAGYYIYRGDSSGMEQETPVNTDLLTEATFIDSNIQKDQTYFYTIKAVNKYGVSSDASDEVFVSGDVGKPTDLKASKKGNKISITWKAPKDKSAGDIVGYYIFKGKSSGKEDKTPLNKQALKDTSFTDVFTKKDKNYFYYVKAVNKYGIYSLPSSEVKVLLN